MAFLFCLPPSLNLFSFLISDFFRTLFFAQLTLTYSERIRVITLRYIATKFTVTIGEKSCRLNLQAGPL